MMLINAIGIGHRPTRICHSCCYVLLHAYVTCNLYSTTGTPTASLQPRGDHLTLRLTNNVSGIPMLPIGSKYCNNALHKFRASFMVLAPCQSLAHFHQPGLPQTLHRALHTGGTHFESCPTLHVSPKASTCKHQRRWHWPHAPHGSSKRACATSSDVKERVNGSGAAGKCTAARLNLIGNVAGCGWTRKHPPIFSKWAEHMACMQPHVSAAKGQPPNVPAAQSVRPMLSPARLVVGPTR
ncbi:hypothetical protein COO60DRAFT_93146 [Scenedesmus sp. NREL 46B-D3]|nr:hypothetical protein COO60DRAFT_93146 [Scenedesmus sp. NREL 46B-D3]